MSDFIVLITYNPNFERHLINNVHSVWFTVFKYITRSGEIAIDGSKSGIPGISIWRAGSIKS